MSARAFIFLAMVVVVSKTQAGAVLRGVVLSNELGGPPMGNIEVSALVGNTNNTDANGKFTFSFPNKKPGDTVRLIVRKEGYVVVNDIQLELTLPADPEERPAIILLCKEGDREEMGRRFYKLKSVEAIDETYKKKVQDAQNASAAELAKLRQERDQTKAIDETYKKKLQDAQNASAAELAKLRQERDQAKALDETYKKKLQDAQNASAAELAKLSQERDQAKGATDTVVEGLAKQKPGVGSELYRTTTRSLLDGKVDRALVALSDEKLRELSKAPKEKKVEAEKTTKEAIQAWLLKGQLLTVQFRFDDAEKAYQGAIETSPESFEANFAFAWFSQQLNHYDKAKSAYGRSLELARRNQDDGEIAMTLNNLAMLDGDQNRPGAARKGFEEALKIYRNLAKNNPDSYLPDVARTVNNLATLNRAQNRVEEARKGYEETLKIYRQLAQRTPDTYLSYVAVTLNNLAVLDGDQNRVEEARKGYEEALSVRRQLAKKNPDAYLPDVAVTLNNLAILDRAQNRVEEARKEYEEALKIRRELAQKNPDAYLLEVARTLNNLAVLDGDQNRPQEA